jgi:anti-sigma regulatory factor (Ser/Thr protein kinase)
MPAQPFHHEALFYDDEESFLAGTIPFIRDGLAAGEPVMVAVGAARIPLLTGALGAEADDVRFVDMAQVGANPAHIIPAVQGFLEDSGRGGPARGIGEPIWAARSADELVECQLHEALINHAFAGHDGVSFLCPYDVGALSPPVLREACRAHPVISAGGRHHPSRTYRGSDAVPPAAGAPLPPPPLTAKALGFDLDTLPEVRARVSGCAERAGLDPTRTGDLVLAVHELAMNSVKHGGGFGVLRTWVEDDTAVCEIHDSGHITDPLAGRHRPRLGQLGGWGLWIANQACDLVQIRSRPNDTVIRVRSRARP